MQVWQRRSIIIGLVVAATLEVGLFLGTSARNRPYRPAKLAATVTIDPNIGETFAPAPQETVAILTAEQAFAQQWRSNGRTVIPIPAGVTVRLGLHVRPRRAPPPG